MGKCFVASTTAGLGFAGVRTLQGHRCRPAMESWTAAMRQIGLDPGATHGPSSLVGEFNMAS
jgi:hypothetical protein